MNKTNHRHSLMALAAALCCSAPAFAELSNESKTLVLSGFGTLSAVQTNNENIQFRSDNRLPNGTAASHAFDNDSKLGVQLSYRPNDQLQAVVQLLSRRNEKNNFDPSVDWAYIGYKPMSALSVRAGRFVAPTLMGSDYRNVGYSNIWVRPPTDVYNSATINNVDGIDAIYRGLVGPVSYSAQAYFGGYDLKFSGNSGIKFKNMAGLILTAEIDSWTLRASHMASRHTNYGADGQAQPTSLFAVSQPATGRGFRFNPGAASCSAFVANVSCKDLFTNFDTVFNAVRRDNKPFNITNFGVVHDDGSYVLQAEFMSRKTDSQLSDSKAYYVTAGYRFNRLLPYVTYSASKTSTQRLKLDVAAPYKAAFDARYTSGGPDVVTSNTEGSTLSLGLRVDVAPSVALKIQLDRYTPKTNSFGATDSQTMSRIGALAGGAAMSESVRSVRLATVALDFVF